MWHVWLNCVRIRFSQAHDINMCGLLVGVKLGVVIQIKLGQIGHHL